MAGSGGSHYQIEFDSKSPRNRGQHEATDPPKFWGVGLGFRAHLAIALPLPRNALHHRGEETTAGEDAYGGAARPVQHGRVEHGHTVTGRVVDG